MAVFWELPLSGGYRLKRNTICLAGVSAGSRSGRHLDNGVIRCNRILYKKDEVIHGGMIHDELAELDRQAMEVDVPYVCIDYKAHIMASVDTFIERDNNGNIPMNVRMMSRSEKIAISEKNVRKLLYRSRKIVNQVPWMKEFIKIDTIRLRIYAYTHVPMDQWFNGVSILKNTNSLIWSKQFEWLMSLGLNESNAAKFIMSFRFGRSAFGNDGSFSITDLAHNSDMMCCKTPLMRTIDIENFARNIIFPYATPMRGSGGYAKFGNGLRKDGSNSHIKHEYTYHLMGGDPYVYRENMSIYTMFAMFHQPNEIDPSVGYADMGRYAGAYIDICADRGIEVLSRQESFDKWLEIFLRIQEEQSNG